MEFWSLRTNVGARCTVPLEQFAKPTSGSLPTIVRYFKSAVTRRINDLRGTSYTPVWQRNYYEHVIRNEDDLNEIREYIANNPVKWGLDSDNPSNSGRKALRPYGNNLRPC